MKLRCRFGWHNWSMWSDYRNMGSQCYSFHFSTITVDVVGQEKRCQDCRLVKIRRLPLK